MRVAAVARHGYERGREREGTSGGIIGEGRPEDGPGGRRARAGCDAVVVGRRADEPEEDPVAPEVPAAPVGGAAGQVVAVACVVDRARPTRRGPKPRRGPKHRG